MGRTGPTDGRRALLLTDVVDSTRLSEALGDARMAAVWAAHDRVARDLLPGHRGLEIDKTDGFLMLFDEAADALAYARAYHRALCTLDPPLKARAGLHVGPVFLRPNPADDVARGAKPLEVDGLAKPTAARVMSLARGGQTLLTAEALDALGPTGLKVESHGHWRVKGVAAPIELFEVGDHDAPLTPPSGSEKVYRVVREGDLWVPVDAVRHTLPAERDAFVGRERDLGELSDRLVDGARLVTVLGPGGAGKTRLVLRYGWTWIGDWPGGVWFCDLAEARTLEQVVAALARTLEVPLAAGDPMVQLGHAIAGRGSCLVVLDTFEQVSRHADEVLGPLLDRAPRARFVVTSRELLGVPGEQAMVLPPLARDEAVALFLARAAVVRPDIGADDRSRRAVSELVDLLDRLPLAIELAAARSRMLPPERLLERMHERFRLLASTGARRDRQATLRATLDWSWELLDPAEQLGLAQISVFEGGFTLDLAESVLDLTEAPGAPWPMDVVGSLVDKSLVRVAGDRFDLLVSVREYAAGRLAERGGVTATHARHGDVFAALPVDRREVEIENLIAACERAVASGRAKVATACLEAGWSVISLKGPTGRGLRLAEAALGLDLAPEERALVLHTSEQAAHALGQVQRAAELGAAALAAFEAVGSENGVALARDRLGVHALDAGRWEQAAALLDQAIEGHRRTGDPEGEATARIHLGIARARQGALQEARLHLGEGLALAERRSDPGTECTGRANLAVVHFAEGDPEGAREQLHRALELAVRAGDRRTEAHLLGNLGAVAIDRLELDEALPLMTAALALHRDLGHRRGEGAALGKLAYLRGLRHEHVEARELYHQALEVAREVANLPEEGLLLGNLGEMLLRMGQLGQAREALRRALEIHRSVGREAFEGHTRTHLGRLEAAEGHPDEARAHLEAALAIHRRLGSARFEGRTLGLLGALHLDQGRPTLARMALEIGEALLRDGPHRAEWLEVLETLARLEEREGDLQAAAATRARGTDDAPV